MAHLFLGDEFTRRKERLLASARGRLLEVDLKTLDDPSLESGSFDTIALVQVLCEAPDPNTTLQRVNSLLADGGQLLVLEHTKTPGVRGVTQEAWAPMWRYSPGGCIPNRDVLSLLRGNGFAVTDCDRFKVRRALPIVASYVSAVAIRKSRPPVEESTSE